MAPYKFKKLTHKEVQHIESSFAKFYSFIGSITETLPQNQSTPVNAEKNKKSLPARLCPARDKNTKPARTVEELQDRLQLLRGKPSLPYKVKLQKKTIKAKLRKKERQEKGKLLRLEAKAHAKSLKKRPDSQDVEKKHPTKPVYDTKGEMVFSKFDFSNLGAKAEKPRVKIIKDPAVALKKLREEQKRLKEFEEVGEAEKVAKIKEKKAWKNAQLKVEGIKVKDNPDLLKTTIKKMKKRKDKSKAKWKANLNRVEKDKEEKQRKRTENLQARSREKKLKKMKTLSKRGRIIAGF